MVHSRFIHTVVSLCLIAAIVTEPLTVVAALSRCESSQTETAAEAVCQGCGQCKVAEPGQRCGCCDGHATSAPSTCCRPAASSANTATKKVANEIDPLFGELSPLVPEPDSRQAHAALSSGKAMSSGHVIADAGGLVGVCRCSWRSQPTTPVAPRVPASETFDTPLLVMAGATPANVPRVPSSMSLAETTTFLQHHCLDVQRQLCIWRL